MAANSVPTKAAVGFMQTAMATATKLLTEQQPLAAALEPISKSIQGVEQASTVHGEVSAVKSQLTTDVNAIKAQLTQVQADVDGVKSLLADAKKQAIAT